MSVAICISIVVVHVGRRLRSLVQPSNVHSSICPRVHILRRFKCSGKVRRPQGSTRFSTSRRRPGPRDNHQEGRWRDTRAFRCCKPCPSCSSIDASPFSITIFAPPCPKVVTKCAKLGCSDRHELDVDMLDEAEATPGLSGALLAAPWRAWCVPHEPPRS